MRPTFGHIPRENPSRNLELLWPRQHHTLVPVSAEPTTPAAPAPQAMTGAPAPTYTSGGVGTAVPPHMHPTGVSSVAAVQGSRGSPGSMHSAGTLSASAQILFDRQDEADRRATRIEHALEHFMNRSIDHMERSEERMEQMHRNQQASEHRSERLAARLTSDSVTAAAANAAQMEFMRQTMMNDRAQERRADAISLEERVAPLIQSAIERNMPMEPSDLPTSLQDMRTRGEAENAETRAALAHMSEMI